MKKLLCTLLIAFLLNPTLGFGAVSLVQTKSDNGGGYVNSYTSSYSSNVTAGNTLIVCFTAGSGDLPTISDDQSNSYTLVASTTDERKTWTWYAYNVAGGATTLTVQFQPAQFSDSALIMREYSGLTTSNPLDKFAAGNDGGGFVQTHSSGATAATTQANELVIGCGGSSGSTYVGWGAGTGYGNLATQNGFDAFTYGAMEDKIVASTGTQTAEFTTIEFVRGQTIVATFFEDSVAPVTPPSTIPFKLNGRANINGRLNISN